MKTLNLKHSALLVIDVQKYFYLKSAPVFLKMAPATIPKILQLIEAFRAKGQPVIYTRHAHKKGKSAGQMGRWWGKQLPWEGSKYSGLIPELSPLPNEFVLTKSKYSAFEGTKLNSILRHNNIDTVVICGVLTNVCIETTARHAFVKDFQPVIVKDACATKSLIYHRASLTNLSYAFAYTVTTKEVIFAL